MVHRVHPITHKGYMLIAHTAFPGFQGRGWGESPFLFFDEPLEQSRAKWFNQGEEERSIKGEDRGRTHRKQ